jgi:multicomponent Na+:H+ antiporter subunit F
MNGVEGWLRVVATLGFYTLVVSLALVFVRLVRGPTLADRVVALDMIGFLAIGIVAVFALLAGRAAFMDAALVLALIAFMATVAFARFVERTAGQERDRR